MVVVHGQVHAAAGDAGLVREDGQRGLVLAVVPPVRARRRDARLDARAPDPRLDDVRVVAVEARGADERAVAVRQGPVRETYMVYEEVDQIGFLLLRRSETGGEEKYRMFLDDYERDAIDASLHRDERVLGVDAVRVEHVRVAAHRCEEHVLQDGRRQ